MTAEILEGLGQTQDALQQLHLSLECLAGDTVLFSDFIVINTGLFFYCLELIICLG